MLEPVRKRIIYRDPRFYAAFPSACTLPDGTVLIAFRRARDHRWLCRPAGADEGADFDSVDHLDCRSHLALVRLAPDLEPYGPPETLPPHPEAADQDASLLALRDGRVAIGGFGWYPVSARFVPALKAMGVGVVGSPERTGSHFIFWGGYTRWSDDAGRTWTPHRFLPAVPGHPDQIPGRHPFHGGPVRGRAVERPDGTLLLPSYAVRPNGRGAALLHRSDDRGEHWAFSGVIAEDESGMASFLEPGLQSLPDGRIMAFCRTGGLGDRLVTADSHDEGRHWTPWRIHAVIGHPFDACPLPDGRLVLVYGYRHPPYGVRARVWDPARDDIAATPEIVIRDDAPSPDVGYPWATVTADGRVLVVHYAADDGGIRHIAATLLAVTG